MSNIFLVRRWALMPFILAKVLQSDPAKKSAEEQVVEHKLMKTLVQVRLFSFLSFCFHIISLVVASTIDLFMNNVQFSL